jgi:hypothetical protein
MRTSQLRRGVIPELRVTADLYSHLATKAATMMDKLLTDR